MSTSPREAPHQAGGRAEGSGAPSEGWGRPSYSPHDVLKPEQVQEALGISDSKWDDVKARIPWSEALGTRTLRIQWARLLSWLGEHERKVA